MFDFVKHFIEIRKKAGVKISSTPAKIISKY